MTRKVRSLGSTQRDLLDTLNSAQDGMTIMDLVEDTGRTYASVFRALRRLYTTGLVGCAFGSTYIITKKGAAEYELRLAVYPDIRSMWRRSGTDAHLARPYVKEKR